METLFALVLYAHTGKYIVDHNLTFRDCIEEMFSSRADDLHTKYPESSIACEKEGK